MNPDPFKRLSYSDDVVSYLVSSIKLEFYSGFYRKTAKCQSFAAFMIQ